MQVTADFKLVELKATSMFGEEARQWLFKPNRTFAQLSPFELAQCPVGARLVLSELDKTLTDA